MPSLSTAYQLIAEGEDCNDLSRRSPGGVLAVAVPRKNEMAKRALLR